MTSTNIVEFRTRSARPADAASEPAGDPGAEQQATAWFSREDVQRNIDGHIAARRDFAKAMAWEAQAEAQNLPQAEIEAARQQTAKALAEMNWRAHGLLVALPHDPKALVDLLMYLEKNFTVLPQEINGRSLAFYLLKTMRLSLRSLAKFGPHYNKGH